MTAYDHGQELRDGGRLREAREQLEICAQAGCPAVIVRECVPWLRELDAMLPSVVVAVRDAAGHDVMDARLWLDDRLVAERIDGTARVVDPGVRLLRVEYRGESIEQKVVVRQGEKNRLITIALPSRPLELPPSSGAAPSASSGPASGRGGGGTPVGVWVGLGVGALALGVFAHQGLSARSDLETLRTTCSPRCSDEAVAPARREALVADVALGTAVVALGIAAYLWLSPRAGASSARRGTTRWAELAGGRWSF